MKVKNKYFENEIDTEEVKKAVILLGLEYVDTQSGELVGRVDKFLTKVEKTFREKCIDNIMRTKFKDDDPKYYDSNRLYLEQQSIEDLFQMSTLTDFKEE
jgi:hypothetical protein